MKVNVVRKMTDATHEGGVANPHIPYITQLKRAVFACLLWENNFYEDGVSIADRIKSLCDHVKPDEVAAIAREARTKMNLRHVPLLLVCALASRKYAGLDQLTYDVIERADEMGELLSIYWKDGKKPIPAAMKRGLAAAFTKFDAYQLGKYSGGAIKLKDVLRLVHPKPIHEVQARNWGDLVRGELTSPDTWEVQLSGGADKKETFERLIREKKLGYMALLRNLRNMSRADVDPILVKDALMNGNASRVLPFRYIAAARAVPEWANIIDGAFKKRLEALEGADGDTVFLVDVSGSMDSKLSSKSDLMRMDAAAALAAIWPGEKRIFSFSSALVEVGAYQGLAAIELIVNSQEHGGTYLGNCLKVLPGIFSKKPKRLIVITDEQISDNIGRPYAEHGYIINVASERPSIAYYGPWTSVTGFSENVLRYIQEHENLS